MSHSQNVNLIGHNLILLYNTLQSAANHTIANTLIQHFKVIYLDVRSLIVADLIAGL